VPVRNFPGQIIVNAGDMLQNLTNGYYRSTTHRVTNNNMDRSRRFSMPFFVHPRAEINLQPIPEALARTGGIPRYERISAGEYFQRRLDEIGFGKPR
jgi:isopenicillin N synthase-like dioxygenase